MAAAPASSIGAPKALIILVTSASETAGLGNGGFI